MRLLHKKKKMMFLNTSRNSVSKLKSKQVNTSKSSNRIKVVSTLLKLLKDTVQTMESNSNSQSLIHLIKMELLRGKAEHWWNVLAACSKVKTFVMDFGLKQ